MRIDWKYNNVHYKTMQKLLGYNLQKGYLRINTFFF